MLLSFVCRFVMDHERGRMKREQQKEVHTWMDEGKFDKCFGIHFDCTNLSVCILTRAMI